MVLKRMKSQLYFFLKIFSSYNWGLSPLHLYRDLPCTYPGALPTPTQDPPLSIYKILPYPYTGTSPKPIQEPPLHLYRNLPNTYIIQEPPLHLYRSPLPLYRTPPTSILLYRNLPYTNTGTSSTPIQEPPLHLYRTSPTTIQASPLPRAEFLSNNKRVAKCSCKMSNVNMLIHRALPSVHVEMIILLASNNLSTIAKELLKPRQLRDSKWVFSSILKK